MTINCGEVCLAVIACIIITIVLYIASWYKQEGKDEKQFKEPNTSNMQGLENDEPTPCGEPNEIIHYDLDQHIATAEHQPSGEIIKEKSDLCLLQEEDFRARVTESDSSEDHLSEGYVNIEDQNTFSEYDAVAHPDSKTGRLHLSIRYDNERSQLIVRILDAQGLIRSGQVYAPEMILTFTLIGPLSKDNQTEKYTRVVVENAAVIWKEPMTFCITYENAKQKNLYLLVSNKSDPVAPRDREVSIPLDDLGHQNEEINQWFDLQFVQTSF